jgi:hypothetical protein
MNRGTIMMVAIALGCAAGAWSMRPQELPPAQFEDTGELLFASFSDPAAASALTVVSWDEDEAQVVRFAVEQKGGLWVIPSHNDYPADGTERMGKAAASFIDVKKDVYYGDKVEDHARYGVLDPDGAEGTGDEKGQRITIKDASGTVLVDVIVGKEPEGKQGFYYVRKPDEKRVYGAKLTLDVSTDFGDWIEKDLLHVERDEVVQVVYDPYSVDEAEGKVVGASPIVASLGQGADGKDAWKAEAPTEVPDGKELDTAKVRQMVTSVANVKIVGVRPRPRPEQLTYQSLQSKGFFVTPDGRQLFGNEGQASIITKDGIVYTLYFGEVTFDSGRALTAGTEAEAADNPEDTEGKTANRYMFVDVLYDATRDQEAAGTPEVPAEGEEPTPPVIDEAAARKGAERAAKLGQRFSKWFYVISDSSFKQIHKDREELFKLLPPAEG